MLGRPADPWQEWLFIHAGELLPDGRPRFRRVLVLVARQNGKTECLVILSCYWQFVDGCPLILGTSTKLEYAKESWKKAVKLVTRCEQLTDLRPSRWTRETNGEQESWTLPDPDTDQESRYKIAASNEEGARSLTVDRLICDELRQHHDYSAWGAADEATSAVWDAQTWALSNAGDDRSVVLNDLRADALAYIKTGKGDYRLGLFEWSCEEDADPTDLANLAQANPNLGRRKDPEDMLLKARRAVERGGSALTSFKTESMCIRVKALNPAIDPSAWKLCEDIGDLSDARSRVVLCLDLSRDGMHSTLVAAAVLEDNRVRLDVVAAWSGATAADQAKAALPEIVARVKPRTFGWFPTGPAAAIASALADRRKHGRRGWPPIGVTVEEIRGEMAAACMGFEVEIKGGMIAHSADPLLDDHVANAERVGRGDAWVFSRKGGHCDALYAAAGAVHLARTLPTPVGKPRLRVAPD